jgi:hypothetical protein
MRGDSASMNQPDAPKIAWRRGRGPTYVGAVSRGRDAIRLAGRDTILGIDVVLSIPIDEIGYVGVEEPTAAARRDPRVIVDLAESDPIYLRPVGGSRLRVHLLARALGALTPAPSVLAQGGSP